ncbi:hypothetical protein PRN20_04645 [Devosia sp. ZB163]|uniref:hypothetical protein n=1 Tax=Devosia sp. ZB163 TaxID=3025938 RepID=UPI00235FBCC1|nr:hypothetical protein [Devosia sp. ZB163]MDC9823011.1 hypothetical protein [Devosia sp. ZB163]
MDAAISSSAYPVLGTLSRLAAALSDPFATFDRDNWSLGNLSPTEMEAIAADPAFRRPVRRAIAGHVSAGLATLSREDFTRIASAPEGRLAIAMLSAPVDEVFDLALLCAGAVFHRDILAATGKLERAALRARLGSDAYLLATQEASGLYPSLAALGDAQQFHAALAEDDSDAGRRHFIGSGLGLLFALIGPVAPALCDLIARRLPPDRRPAAAPSAKPGDIGRLLRLIDRRRPSWLATIG